MKSFLKTHVVPAMLIVTVFASNFLLLSVPRLAQADSGTACQGGAVVAIAAYAWAKIKDTIGVPSGPGQAEQGLADNRQSASSFINDCILKPLAQMMIVALIRNIGASVVNWVNTGFEGKPAFVTNFAGTLLDAADQAAGNFIESSDLGFLCSPFSFQIRIALALKYSEPFNDQVRCTLTDISNNVNDFANNNGGAGWDNWLKITTEPQNNVYGAFLITDSELAKRMANAVNIKESRISLGQGFLDFETCDQYETDGERNLRLNSGGTFQAPSSGETHASVTNPNGNYNPLTGTDYISSQQQTGGNTTTGGPGSLGSFSTVLPTVGSGVLKSTDNSSNASTFLDSVSSEKKCLKSSTKTPGQVIASQLNSEFATGPIQRAVAQEIDQVISATLNQLAQKAIQGASGLLGLSQKRQSNTTSYIEQYRAKYYGQSTTATVGDTGAQSELDAYTVGNYDDALALRNDSTNQDIQKINQFTATVGGAQVQAQNDQTNSTIAAYGDTNPEVNVALGKTSNESSVLNSAGNGNDGIKQTSQYVKGAETSSSEAGGWWEVDLGENKNIQKINIYPNATPSAPNGGLGTFTVEVRSTDGTMSSYPASTFTSSGNTDVLTGTIGRTGRYVRIERQANEISCPEDYYGRSYSSSPCLDQPHLAFAELEVIEKIDLPTTATTTTSTGTGASSPSTNTTTPVDTGTATSTLSWNPQIVSSARVSSNSGLSQVIKLSATKSVSGVVAEVILFDAQGRRTAFSSVFSSFDILRGSAEGLWTSSQADINKKPDTSALRIGLSINQNGSFFIKIAGLKKAGAPTGNYSFITQVEDSTHTVLEDKTQRINFVVE